MRTDEYYRLIERARLNENHARLPKTKEEWNALLQRRTARNRRAAITVFVAIVFVLVVLAVMKLCIEPESFPQELSCSR